MSEMVLYSAAGHDLTMKRVEDAIIQFPHQVDPGHRGWVIWPLDRKITVRPLDADQLTLPIGLALQIRMKLSMTGAVPRKIRSAVKVTFDEYRFDEISSPTFAPNSDLEVLPEQNGRVVVSRIAYKLAGWNAAVVIHDVEAKKLVRITPSRSLNP